MAKAYSLAVAFSSGQPLVCRATVVFDGWFVGFGVFEWAVWRFRCGMVCRGPRHCCFCSVLVFVQQEGRWLGGSGFWAGLVLAKCAGQCWIGGQGSLEAGDFPYGVAALWAMQVASSP